MADLVLHRRHVDQRLVCSQEVPQVRTDTWSKGRVVLAKAAAHCVSPYSGVGVSGGLVGAYVLVARHATLVG
nr:FAD-dependent monooxygenase [Actinophytocola algeriensis]